MFRVRRYRGFLILAVLTVFAFYYFGHSDSWDIPELDFSNGGGKVPKPEPVQQDIGGPKKLAEEPAKELNPLDFAVSAAEQVGPKIPPPSPAPAPTKPPAGPAPAHNEEVQETVAPSPEDDEAFEKGGEGRVEVEKAPASTPQAHWTPVPERFPVPSKSIITLPTGKSKDIPKIQHEFGKETEDDKALRLYRLDIIKEAFSHAWSGYVEHAWLEDELSPVSGKSRNPFAGWGATLVDALDTLWIMGMTEEFERAVEGIKTIDFTTSPRPDIPVFETTIRYLGGLLAAYDISEKKYKTLLDKAVELADILMSVFDTPNRMPVTYYYWKPSTNVKPLRASSNAVMAEVGSLSVEFTRLAQLTGDDKYYDAVARITDAFEELQGKTNVPGLWPQEVDASGCKRVQVKAEPEISEQADTALEELDGGFSESPSEMGPEPEEKMVPLKKPEPLKAAIEGPEEEHATLKKRETQKTVPESYPGQRSHSQPAKVYMTTECFEHPGLANVAGEYNRDSFTLGGQADSTYEYLPKMYLLLGGQVEKYKTMYNKVADAATKYLLFRPMIPDDLDILMSGIVRAGKNFDGETEKGDFTAEGSHLTCFAGGMFALGSKIFGRADIDLASKLTDGCVWAYNVTNSGIMPENFYTIPCSDPTNCKWNQTLYEFVIDPREDYRKKTYEDGLRRYSSRLSAYNALMTKLAESSGEDGDNADPASATVTWGGSDPAVPTAGLERRQVRDEVDDDVTETPTRTSREQEVHEEHEEPAHPLVTPPTRPTPPLGRKEFVEQRIADERIPPGMVRLGSRSYILRPEAIESVFYMYRTTGDRRWREAGWQMFQAVEQRTRVTFGHSAIDDVTKSTPHHQDEMESFWLAETLKYFYLLFAEENVVSLDEWVLNTEAHPFRRPK